MFMKLFLDMTDLAELWNFDFESDTFEQDVLELWSQVNNFNFE